MALGALVEKTLGKDTLKKLITEHCQEDRGKRYLTPENRYVRASSFAEMCPRQEVLCAVNRIPRKNSISSDLQMIFAHGTGLHYALQNVILPMTKVLMGQWRCLGCPKTFGGTPDGSFSLENLVPHPGTCDECGSSDFFYMEQKLESAEYGVGGHPDGFLQLRGYPGLGLFEAKSVSHASAIKIQDIPDYGHVVQMHIYMWLSGVNWGRLLYWDKTGYNVMGTLTEHHIDRDEEVVKSIKDTLTNLWQGISTGDLPPRHCESLYCPKAKSCNVRKMCFETK